MAQRIITENTENVWSFNHNWVARLTESDTRGEGPTEVLALCDLVLKLAEENEALKKPIDMVLHCPACGRQHIDVADEVYDYDVQGYGDGHEPWTNPPHRSHLCRGCGHIWRPADVATNGVKEVKTYGANDSPAATPVELPDDGELAAWAETGSQLLLYVDDPDQQTIRRAAHLLQNAYMFASALKMKGKK